MDLNIYTMCRSGNHAIIFWLIDNICEIKKSITGCCYWNDDEGMYFYNNCNHILYNFVNPHKFIIKSYEDITIDKNLPGLIIIVRDFTNFIASRYKKYGGDLGLNNSYLQNYAEIRDLWIELCNTIITNDTVIGIIYNKWLIDKEYRDNIAEKIGIKNINDNISIVSDIGEGSSFCGIKLEESNTAYLTRFNKELFHDDYELYEKIMYDYENDKEIQKIRSLLFK